MAAGLAVAATAASAQVLTAEIPFSFTMGSEKLMQPGNYNFRSNAHIWSIRNNDSHKAALAMSYAATHTTQAATPKLVFHCRTNSCALYAIEIGGGDGALFLEPRRSKADADELAHVVIVPLTSSSAE
ncbi:MAG: hypothetical protein C5B51_21325 [Terriglobia bacterium]|nr:MAG: hypothetical protein C5B51_21325 [Terriglobia bacterium]